MNNARISLPPSAIAIFCLICCAMSPSAVAADEKENKANSNITFDREMINVPPRTATFLALDKITARKKHITINSGQIVEFGTLYIRLRHCEASPDDATIKEAKTFVEVYEKPPGGDGVLKRIFSGWMFASTPSINALEHAVYDIWPISCKARAPSN